MLVESLILAEFLASLENPLNEINAIVHKIAKIVITTINSISVNHFFIIIFFMMLILCFYFTYFYISQSFLDTFNLTKSLNIFLNKIAILRLFYIIEMI
jgi:hypothetical protein